MGEGGKGPFWAQGSVGHLGVIPKLFRMAYGAEDAMHAAIGLRTFGASGPKWSEVVPKLIIWSKVIPKLII